MNRERAETHLRLLAEAERRRVMALPADSAGGQWYAPRLALVAQALCAVGAVDAGTAKQIQADFDLASAARQLSLLNAASPGPGGLSPDVRGRLERLRQVQLAHAADQVFPVSGHGAGQVASRQATWRVVPVGQVIPNDGFHGELVLLAYLQTADGARFAVAQGMAGSPGRHGPGPEPGRQPQRHRFSAADDQGTSYQPRLWGRPGEGVLELRPDPPHQIRWLDLTTAPGEPAIRIDLGPQDPPVPAPDVTVTQKAHSPGELLLDVIAAGLLTSAADFPQDNPEQLAAATAGLRAFVADGPGDIVAALQAADTLPAASPVPGQLAGLCARLGVSGHGITAPPADDLPEPWQSMLTRYHHRKPYRAPAPGSWAVTVAELPELDGTRIAILGLYHGEVGTTILHTLVSGVTREDEWTYSRVVRPLPVLWIRDSSGRWHTTQTDGTSHSGDNGEVVLWLRILPPLDRGTAWIDVVAAGQSAEARATLSLSWK